jgi:dipeptide/tripeptide permease
VADRKTLLRIALVFLPVPMFWALFNQTSSTWVLQGSKMTSLSHAQWRNHARLRRGVGHDLGAAS